MFSSKSIYFVIFTLILCKSRAEISDKRLCIDDNCSELISVGKTLLKYASPETNVLSFLKNEDVKVYSYGAGTREDLVGVEINGRRGYINKAHFRETNLFKRPLQLVNTNTQVDKPGVSLGDAAAEIKADPTQQPFEIVDGTKIPLDVASFSTEAPVINAVSEQSSGETTKPLDSVSDNQNVNPAGGLKEPNIVDTEQNTNTNNQQHQQEQSESNKDDEDDDDDDESDDADLEDDKAHKDNPTENKITERPNKGNVAENISTSENLVVETNTSQANASEVNNNLYSTEVTSDPTIKEESEKAISKDSSSESGDSSPNEKLKDSASAEDIGNEKIDVQLSQNNESDIGTLGEFNADNLNVEATKTPQNQPNEGKTNIASSSPLVNMLGANQNPELNDFSKEASDLPSYEDVKKIDNPENPEKEMLDKTKEPISSEEPFIPLSSTEQPIDIEAIPPIELDLVTPNPANSLDTEESKNDTEDDPSITLPNDLMSELKGPEEGIDKVEEKSDAGFFTGLREIFNTGVDHVVDKESSHPPYEENENPDESLTNQQPAHSESSFSNNTPEKDDSSQHLNSDSPTQSGDHVALETNISDTTEQQELPQNLNIEAVGTDIEQTDSSSIKNSLENQEVETSEGLLSKISSFFVWEKTEDGVKSDGDQDQFKQGPASSNILTPKTPDLNESNDPDIDSHSPWSSSDHSKEKEADKEFCDTENCPKYQEETIKVGQETVASSRSLSTEDLQIMFIEAFSSDLFLYLTTTALSVIFLVFGMVILDKCRREGPLIARINKLEQQLMTTMKENEMLQEKCTSYMEEQTQFVVETVPNKVVEELNQKLAEMHLVKLALEEQIQALEKELDTSTEVGIELNKILSEMLNSSDGSEIIKENIEQMQKKLLEQQDTINTINATLSLKETENHELTLEMEISNRKVTDLQSELDRLVDKLLKIEEERDQQHSALESEIIGYQIKCKETLSKEHTLNSEIQVLKQQLTKSQRLSDVKVKEYNILKESLNEIKAVKNNKDVFKSLLEVSEIKAHLEQLKLENMKYSEQLSQERKAKSAYGTKIEFLTQEVSELREKYEQADREKVEINTKLQVLNNYFKEKEDQMQKEISKYESLWAVKEGEATSTTERIRYMQEELQNYKAHNESLKQEIVNQEVELKSQISMLEKKSHESWVTNRQTERKLEEARQEAAQLRNRLTLRERAIADGTHQTRMQSPLHQNGEMPLSPIPLDPTQSPPPLFNPRDHLAKSPPIPGMPPPFLPPPLGATPFIPPPPLDGMMPSLGDIGGMPPHFMPPLPPGMYPGDHRPPPLGRMSSPPPVGGRYTPESTVYSDYDRYGRRTPSPPYDSEYGASPPPIRGYSPYQDRLRDDRREYKRPQARSNGRSSKGMLHSSGSENDSLGKINKKPPRKV